MDPDIARNQNYDDHYAYDSEDVHSALLPLHDDGAAMLSHPMCPPLFIPSQVTARFDEGYKQAQVIVIATAYIPNSHPLRRAERAPGQQESVPYLPPKYLLRISLLHMWVQDDYAPASDSTYGNDLFFGGSGQVKVSWNATGLSDSCWDFGIGITLPRNACDSFAGTFTGPQDAFTKNSLRPRSASSPHCPTLTGMVISREAVVSSY